MRVYVAASFEEKHVVRDAYERLRAAGHEITHDWTDEDVAHAEPGKMDEFLAKCAELSIEGVMEADVVVVFPSDAAKGTFVEIGCALAAAIPIVCVKRGKPLPYCVFLNLEDVHHAENIDQAVVAIGRGRRPTWLRRAS